MHLTRYADDFVVVTPDEETAEDVKQLLIGFLKERGLELSLEKTLITPIDKGFDFLGFNLRKYNGKLIIKPSKKSFTEIKSKVRQIVRGCRASTQEELIKKLNPVVMGWCNYHAKVCSKQTFKALHDYMFTVLRQWAHRRHSRSNPNWVIGRYWHKVEDNEYVFSCGELVLKSPKSVAIRRHVKVRSDANPYLEKSYFEARRRPGGTTLFKKCNRS